MICQQLTKRQRLTTGVGLAAAAGVALAVAAGCCSCLGGAAFFGCMQDSSRVMMPDNNRLEHQKMEDCKGTGC